MLASCMKPLLIVVAACAMAAATPAQADTPRTPRSKSSIEVAASEAVMSMRVDGELLIGPEGEVREHRISTEVHPTIRKLIEDNIAGWRFHPVKDADGKPVLARTLMRITVLARPGADDSYALQIENVRFHDGEQPDYKARARSRGIERMTGPRVEYPQLMLVNGVQGSALVHLQFKPNGTVRDAVVVQSAMFNVKGDPELLQRAVAQMERETLRGARRMRVQFAPDFEHADDASRSGYIVFVFTTLDDDKDIDEQRKAGVWRHEQRGPLRAPVMLENGAAIRIGISDVDGSEGLIDGQAPRIRPISGVPTL
ncbi:hypothetical protein [Luteimonas sp. e5]